MSEPSLQDSKREPVISVELAEALADLLTEYKIASPFSVDYGTGADKPPPAINRIPYDWEGLPDYWDLDVHLVLANRTCMKAEKLYHATIDAFAGRPYATETMRTYLHEQHGTDGWTQPVATSLSRLRERFMGTLRPKAHAEDPGHPKMPVLRLDHAIMFNRRLDAWADYASYLVPMDLNPVKGMELNDVLQTLHRFVDALLTSNGYAGVGSSWTVHIHPSAEFVILTSRSSIPE